jgi:tRNA G18 (ribose-2'-O)-methylase SpoU
MLDLAEARGLDAIALAPRGEARIEDLAAGPRRLVLLGAEGLGLPPSVLARARGARIDIAADFDSLNVAVACGIALHALARK